MHALLRLAYSAAGETARLLSRVAPSDAERGGKLTRSLGGRRGVTERFQAGARVRALGGVVGASRAAVDSGSRVI